LSLAKESWRSEREGSEDNGSKFLDCFSDFRSSLGSTAEVDVVGKTSEVFENGILVEVEMWTDWSEIQSSKDSILKISGVGCRFSFGS